MGVNTLLIGGVVGCLFGLAAALWAWGRERHRCVELTERLSEALEGRSEDQTALTKRKELDRIKDEFISTVSHELRTPLTSIRGALGLLSSGVAGQVDAKAQNLLRIANNNTDRLVRLINDILDLQRMDSGQAPLQLRPCLLPEVVSQAADTMRSMADTAGVRLDVVPAGGEPIAFEGDPDRMQQVLCNLLSNAIKFSPPGSAVRVESRVEDGTLLLRVEDRGRGVPADKLESIFERFGQVDPSDARQKGGTGLGLAICRAIMAQHGGEVWAERNDENGDGTPGVTVCVRLPRLQTQGERSAPSLPQGSVLVVDDDSTVREVVAEHLRRHGYSVLEADGGAKALEIAAQGGVEAILLDLSMPGMNGWETLERLKQNAMTAKIPVVVLSVFGPAAGKTEPNGGRSTVLGLPLGSHLGSEQGSPQGWVQKPFEESLLLEELGKVLHAGSRRGRILLVEDDADLAAVMMALFGRGGVAAGWSVQHVCSVSEAKAQCELQQPDLMILDLTLPDGDGFALVDWLRRHNELRAMPLVVFSGHEVNEAEMAKLRLGPTEFLTKARVQPGDVEKLVLTLMRNMRPPAAASPTKV